jgi:hypothetical protein
MWALYIFQIATRILTSKLPKLFSINEVLPIDKWNDVQKSHFQLAKVQKMNISKHTNKYRTDVSLNLSFRIGMFIRVIRRQTRIIDII